MICIRIAASIVSCRVGVEVLIFSCMESFVSFTKKLSNGLSIDSFVGVSSCR